MGNEPKSSWYTSLFSLIFVCRMWLLQAFIIAVCGFRKQEQMILEFIMFIMKKPGYLESGTNLISNILSAQSFSGYFTNLHVYVFCDICVMLGFNMLHCPVHALLCCVASCHAIFCCAVSYCMIWCVLPFSAPSSVVSYPVQCHYIF